MEENNITYEEVEKEILEKVGNPDLAEALDYITRAKVMKGMQETVQLECCNYIARTNHIIELDKEFAIEAYTRYLKSLGIDKSILKRH